MRTKLIILCFAAILLVAGCGPTLQDTKVQYVIGVNSATAALEIADVLRQANKLTPADVNAIRYASDRFEVYRSQVRAAIDANVIAPVNARNGMAATLTEVTLIIINKQGVK